MKQKISLLHDSLIKIKKTQKYVFLIRAFTQATRAVILYFLMFYWMFYFSNNPILSHACSSLCLAMSLYLGDWKIKQVKKSSLLLALDMDNPNVGYSIYDSSLWSNPTFIAVWQQAVKLKENQVLKSELKRLYFQIKILAISTTLVFLSILIIKTPFQTIIKKAFKNENVHSITLKVEKGLKDFKKEKTFILNARAVPTIELTESNLLILSFHNNSTEQTIIDIKNNDNQLQSFATKKSNLKTASSDRFKSLKFSLSSNSSLSLRGFSKNRVLANFKINSPPIPIVKLLPAHKLAEPWQDTKELPLLIQVKSKKPLYKINLLYFVGGKSYRENIHTITSNEMLDLKTKTSIKLAKYMNDDYSNIEITAEAIDQSHPTPRRGYSKPLRLKVISSYGLYRHILNNLKEIRNSLDSSLSSQKPNIIKKSLNKLEQALHDSNRTSFFDLIDRSDLQKINSLAKQLSRTKSINLLYQTHWELTRFLQEHELLNDRERDRDFFVAARGLSRLIERKADNKILKNAELNILKFLKARQTRWRVRIGFLSKEHYPNRWPQIKKEPFKRAIMTAVRQEDNQSLSFETLSKTVSNYREWLEEIESLEDQAREDNEAKRQKGLTDARKVLKKLQDKQLEVSSRLDHAGSKIKEDLDEVWPIARRYQNSNINATKKFNNSLQKFSPNAAVRLAAALKSMKNTLLKGNKKNYIKAESYSDLAGRLLRKAESTTYEKRRKSNRQRRKLRSDSYFGRHLVEGDINLENEYEVSPQYRQNVLEEILDSNYDGKKRLILNQFLRKILR